MIESIWNKHSRNSVVKKEKNLENGQKHEKRWWKISTWKDVPVITRCMNVQSCPSPYNPMDCSPSGSSVHGIFQERILEWVAISFSRGSYLGSNTHLLCLLHWQADSLPLHHLGRRLPVSKVQIKTKMSYHYKSIWMANLKYCDSTKC